jgi:hypothetical protein
MTDSDIEAKLEALERELEQARLNRDDPYCCAPIYRRIGNIGVSATELLFRLLEIHPEAAYVIRQLRNIAERAKDPVLARRVLEAVIPHYKLDRMGVIDTVFSLGPQMSDPQLRDRMVELLVTVTKLKDDRPYSFENSLAEKARKALLRLGGVAARQALEEPTEEFTLFFREGSSAYSPDWTVFVRNGLFWAVEKSGERTYIGNLDQPRTKVFKHGGAPASGKGTCVGRLTSPGDGPGIVSPNADSRWGPVDPWLKVSRGRITHQIHEGDYMVAHDLGKGEGGPDDLILAAALLLIETERWYVFF